MLPIAASSKILLSNALVIREEAGKRQKVISVNRLDDRGNKPSFSNRTRLLTYLYAFLNEGTTMVDYFGDRI